MLNGFDAVCITTGKLNCGYRLPHCEQRLNTHSWRDWVYSAPQMGNPPWKKALRGECWWGRTKEENSLVLCVCVFLFWSGCFVGNWVTQASLKFTVWTKLALNVWFSCIYLSNAGSIAMGHQAWWGTTYLRQDYLFDWLGSMCEGNSILV